MIDIPKVEQCSTACFVDKLVPDNDDSLMAAADFIAGLVVNKGDVPAEKVAGLIGAVNEMDCSKVAGACPRYGTVENALKGMGGFTLLQEFVDKNRASTHIGIE